MADRMILDRLGHLMVADVAAGRLGPNSEAACLFLEAQPKAALDLLDMFFAESRKKRANEKLVSAFAFMIGRTLEFARFAVESGHEDASDLVEAVRQRLLVLSKESQAEPTPLLLILREFALAKLDPGPELRQLILQFAHGAAVSAPEPKEAKALDAHLENIARAVGNDPFELYDRVREMVEAFPDDQRAAMGASLLQSRESIAREAAVGWLLDAASSVRNSAASSFEQAAAVGGVSGSMLRRLIAVRNWLPEPDRMSLDRAIQTCRRKGVEISALPQPQVREVLASGIDGAGAQSIFVIAREGRKNAFLCLLLKQGIGVRDVCAHHGLTRPQCDDLLEHMNEIDLFPTTLDYVHLAAAHALAVNLKSGVMPPFAMLDFIETTGLQGLQPQELSTEAVMATLAAEADPALSQPEAIASALASSRELPDEFMFLDSWFESDTEIERLLGGKKLSKAKRIALVRDELLPRRMAKWIERLAWTALTLRHGEEEEPWEEFFASAKELSTGRALRDIPLMAHAASLTVEAFADRRSTPSRRKVDI
jgi:hypothetical protein